jgi:uncharacterized protein (DUF427 family)
MTEPALAKPGASGFAANPDYRIEFLPCPKRVRVVFNGTTIADSCRAMLMRETGHTPVYYFPRADVRTDLMRPTARHSHCPYKGDASYWTLGVGDRAAENAVWSYQAPFEEVAEIKDYLGFYWDRMDHWYEEDEEVFVHPRDPHVRVDVRLSHRPVRVVLGGETIAESRRARFLFETGLPTRYYIPQADVRIDLLEPSATRSACPYKGTAVYWSARLGEARVEDVAWSYPEPLPECAEIAGHLAFYPERVEAIVVDGGGAP